MYEYDANEPLLPYQKRWIEDNSQLKIAEKSRRTGLTWAQAADDALTASSQKSAGGCNCFYVGSNKEMAREFIDAVAMWASVYKLAASDIAEEVFNDEDKDILTFVVHFASGFKVQALSSNPSNLRGMQGNVTIDEAAFHERLPEVLKAALALTMWGSKVRLISTHNGVDSTFNELINDARASRNDYKVHRITLDDACEQGLYKRICQVSGQQWSQEKEDEWKAGLLRATATQEDAMEEYYCVPKQSGSAYISRVLIEARMVDAPVIRYQCTDDFNSWAEHLKIAEIRDWCDVNLLPILKTLNPKNRHCFAEDFARVADLTVIAPLEIDQGLKRNCPFIVELRNMPYKQQEQVLFYIVDRLPRLQAGALDNKGNGGYLAEQAANKYGSSVEKIELSQRWYLENMPPFKAAFEDDSISIPKDADIAADLRAIQVIKGIPKVPDVRTGVKKDRHGDTAVALCLAWYASCQDLVLYEYESVKNPVPGSEDDDQDNYCHASRYGSHRGIL